VRGSWHYPQTHYDYDEEGLASWYGPGFHGKPKPYGEPFDQNALTAAHKTLPLPSIVNVTNLENGKSAVVLVDDRGPFVYEGRIIDLSIASAKAVGSYSKGIARVRVQTLEEESKALAHYLARYGSSGRDPSGRTWRQIYDQEIAGRAHHHVAAQPPAPKPLAKPTSSNKALAPKGGRAGSIPHDNLTHLLQGMEASPAGHDKLTHPLQPLTKPAKPIYIHTGQTFLQERNVEALVRKLPPQTPYTVESLKHPSGQKMYELKIGPFDSKDKAVKLLAALKPKGFTQATIK
jgi:rare lipoprotein A